MENEKIILAMFSVHLDNNPLSIEFEENDLIKLLKDFDIEDPESEITRSILRQEVQRVHFNDPYERNEIVIKLTDTGVKELKMLFGVDSNENNQLDDDNMINIKTNVIEILEKNKSLFDSEEVLELIEVLSKKTIETIKFAIVCRKLCENIANKFAQKSATLFDNIHEMENIGVPKFITSYFHVLRHFGNTCVHPNKPNPQFPIKIDQKDITIALFALDRVIEFYVKNPK